MRIAARDLAAALEPFAGQVYFAPECHEKYVSLGFAASPAKIGAVALPDGPAYFRSRGSVMGQVPGEVVSAAFGVFNPAVVLPAVAYGWTLTDAATIERARTDGASSPMVWLAASSYCVWPTRGCGVNHPVPHIVDCMVLEQ
ncbi:hypothetical protein MHPYR_190018 [uncultured Mycobacterium sp.]|uniref:Uncharacterized protein n=1 Tax=uncultured Mycobacterium sp. TaxID=171292 RepID=A0A1Y5P9T7_9MYCO|nr:hypothetical protein MHPYR_190018 [uncultured Mycobacterium sp.]